jgi:CRISPR-associated endoribonuclease Cas6
MRFFITLLPQSNNPAIPFSYPYALAAVIYKKLADADEAYAQFLHQEGYVVNGSAKHFKFFTFSSLQGSFGVAGNALQLKSPTAGLVLCSHIPEFAQRFITGIFKNQQITIGGRGAKSTFTVQQIEALPPAFTSNDNTIHRVELSLLSPLVVTRHNQRGYDDYLLPEDPDFIAMLQLNLVDKLKAAYSENYEGLFTITPRYQPGRLRSRLVTIKEGEASETKVRGYTGFTLEITAPGKVIQMGLDSGLGAMNSIGFGCVEVIKG